MTEKEKMLAGEVYSAIDPELIEELMATREVLYEYNSLHPSETLRMKEILKGLLGHGEISFEIHIFRFYQLLILFYNYFLTLYYLIMYVLFYFFQFTCFRVDDKPTNHDVFGD